MKWIFKFWGGVRVSVFVEYMGFGKPFYNLVRGGKKEGVI